jgi:hypothetical protein
MFLYFNCTLIDSLEGSRPLLAPRPRRKEKEYMVTFFLFFLLFE